MDGDSIRAKRAERLAVVDLFVNWELTHRCNLRCPTCHVAAGEGPPDDLSPERYSDLLESVLTLADAPDGPPTLGFTFTGGEPTLNPNLPDFVAQARAKSQVKLISVVTNGLLATGDLLRRLADNGLDWLAVSVDGANRETHDSIRAPGSFDAAVKAIRFAVEHTEVFVSTSLTLTKANQGGLESYVRMIYELGGNQAHVNPFIPAGRGARHEELYLSPEGHMDLMRRLRALEMEYLGRGFLVTYGEPFFGLTDPVEVFGESKYVEKKAACGVATKAVTLSPTGDVLPCAYMRGLVVANALKESLATIWWGETMTRLRDDTRLEGTCGECAFRQYCRGCRARAFVLTGDPFAADPLCPLALAAGRKDAEREGSARKGAAGEVAPARDTGGDTGEEEPV